MKKYICAAGLLILLASNGSSQWRKVRDFYDTISTGGFPGIYPEPVTDIYFLDLPGPPRIGLAGAGSHLYRTTDGGQTWKRCWGDPVNTSPGAEFADIYFKDSLVGWFTFNGANGQVWRTGDGGISWDILPQVVNEWYPWLGIHYISSSERLYLSQDRGDGGVVTLESKDFGATWDTLNIGAEYFSFFNDSVGVALVTIDSFTMGTFLRTSNGGITWDTSEFRISATGLAGLSFPQSLSNTNISFDATAGQIQVYRSNNYGLTWELLKDFGPPLDSSGNHRTSAPIGTGDIAGDLSRLYIQTDTGMYVSTDQGISWQFDGGPAAVNSGQSHRFYAGNGVTFAGMDTGSDYGSLWEEVWPQSGVAEEPSAKDSVTASPNPTSDGTIISFGISKEAYVKIEVFDLLGNKVSSAGFSGTLAAGSHAEPVSLLNLPAGTYFARIVTAYGEVQTVKLVKQ